MSLAHDYRREAIERRNRMKQAGLQRLAVERKKIEPVIWPPVYIEAVPANQVPDELRKARSYKFPSITDIKELVCEYFNVTEIELLSKRRGKDIITARHTTYWLCKQATPHSFPQIGRFLGGYDHTTVLHGYRRINERIEAEEAVAHDCQYLLGELIGVKPQPYWGA